LKGKKQKCKNSFPTALWGCWQSGFANSINTAAVGEGWRSKK
jgi:hypothetical protein